MTPGVLSDQQARRLLGRRDREEAAAARKIARRLLPGTCPVCELDPPPPEEETPVGLLIPTPPPAPLRPFLRRPALRCTRCGLQAQARPSRMGWALALCLALALALGGMSAIFAAQRLDEPVRRGLGFLWGAALFGGGLLLAYNVQGAGSTAVLAQRVLRARRRLRRRRQGAPREEPLPEGPGWFGENLEAVVVAVILALIIRHFVMEAFVIPTGSMAPTLLGDHFTLTCGSCGYAFAVGKDEHELQQRDQTLHVDATCPLCRTGVGAPQRRGDVIGGDKILVNKFLYRLREPRRFEVIVFKFPEAPHKNFIKRLVGLPGETLEVKNGDLWVNGRLCRKPDEVQDAIWIPVLDAAHPRSGDGGAPLWRPRAAEAEGQAAWDLAREERPVCRPPRGSSGGGRAAPWLELGPWDVDDTYAYARGGWRGRTEVPVADLRVRARVTCAGAGAVRLGIREDERVVAARFPVGQGTYAIEVDGEVQQEGGADASPLPVGRPVEIALAYADDQARLIVDGRTVLRWEDPFAPGATRETARPRLQAEGSEVVFDGLRVDRDVTWVRSSWGGNDQAG